MLTNFSHTALFTSDEINKILNHMGETSDTLYPVYMDGNWNDIGCKMQSSDLEWNDEINWFFIKLSKWIDSLQLGIKLVNPPHAVFRKYVVGDFFIKHIDQPPNPKPIRYMSVCIQLSNESEYEGGNVYVYAKNNKQLIPKTIGYTYAFGIKVPHEVTPITNGIRKSLTIFVSENHIKRTNLL
jgi:predicted 2-oxoglutarate/Fe(II)-dependent dioxygenase YbiX